MVELEDDEEARAGARNETRIILARVSHWPSECGLKILVWESVLVVTALMSSIASEYQIYKMLHYTQHNNQTQMYSEDHLGKVDSILNNTDSLSKIVSLHPQLQNQII